MEGIVILKLASIIGVALIVAAATIGASLGDASVASKAVEGVARQPEARSSIFTTMLIGIGLVEATPIIAVVVALILLYFNPLL